MIELICDDLNFTNVGINQSVNFTFSDKYMGMYELNQNLAKVRGNGFIFTQMNNFKIKIYSYLSHINIHHYLKLRIPMCYRLFLRRILIE